MRAPYPCLEHVISGIFGNTSGLKASQIRQLERLGIRHTGTRDVITSVLARGMAQAADDTSRMVGVLVDRRGAVTEVILGEPTRLYLPDLGRQRSADGRLRGVRLLVAKPTRDKHKARKLSLDGDLITDLEKLRLDLVVQFEALSGGEPGATVIGHVLPDPVVEAGQKRVRHHQEHFHRPTDIDWDAEAFIVDLEGQLSRVAEAHIDAENLTGDTDVAVLVGAYTGPRRAWQASLAELTELAKTAGVHVVDTVVQQRKKLDPRTIVGKGKLEQICLDALHVGAEVLIFDCDLSPSQLNAITTQTDLKVLDRTMLILDIFARRATTKGGRLQVELAQLKYSLPRLAKNQSGLSRLTGGIGGRGPGETKLELDRRRAKDRIAKMEREIDRLGRERQLRRKRRNSRDVPVIAIVGYTNAGKSTLLNALTGAEVYAKNELFATLDPTSRRLRFPEEREVVLTDTVGFIRDLPPTLLNAFRATLEELSEADLLLHVVDASDPRRDKHIEAVQTVLDDLELTDTPRVLALNKIDAMDPEEAQNLAERLDAKAVSAIEKRGFGPLLAHLERHLWHEASRKRWMAERRRPPRPWSPLGDADPDKPTWSPLGDDMAHTSAHSPRGGARPSAGAGWSPDGAGPGWTSTEGEPLGEDADVDVLFDHRAE